MGAAAVSMNVRLEIAVDHPQAALAAANGGAERLELCASLADGGLTPSPGLIDWALAAVSIPIHGIVRPRPGNFHYSAAELDVMLRDIEAMRKAGAHGVVAGVLTAERQVVDQAAGRIEIMGGAGVRLNNAGRLWRTIPIDTLHASLRTPWREAGTDGPHAARVGSRDEDELYTVREEDVRSVVSTLEPRGAGVR